MHSNKNCVIIGITGPTRSGKTTLAMMLKEKFACPVIQQDNYFD
jgi:uridine kinase